MQLLKDIVLIFVFGFLYSSTVATAQETIETESKFLIGLSVKVFGSNRVDYQLFDFKAMQGSQKSFTFNTEMQYNLSPRLFITAGVGLTNLNFTGLESTSFKYTETGNISASPTAIIQPYNIALENDLFNQALTFYLETQKKGDFFDQKEGDALYAKFYWQQELLAFNFPVALNYKLQLEKLAFYAGIGPSFYIELAEKSRSQTLATSNYIIDNREAILQSFSTDDLWHDRNKVGPITTTGESYINSFLVEANLKFGLIKELRNNLFILDMVYGRTLNGFSKSKNLETLGVQISWRTRL